ncbi:hypothetical protein HPB50_004236 [Hyalomma asiaticum]|uniref:Uncharacterized protein n=1 Tax=Hyalomma asiaticum TaxID=266040 RepID=A0ACB7T4I1_HYAAI|nr:hypothetical protein HPB50_004236 [Hyalomma asiaticum]
MAAVVKAGSSKQTSKGQVDEEHVEVLDDDAENVSDNELVMQTTKFKTLVRMRPNYLQSSSEYSQWVQCDNVVTTEHLEKVLPQLVLDFP